MINFKQFEKFISKSWHEPAEKKIVKLLFNEKEKAKENEDKLKEFLSDFFKKNKTTIQTLCSEEFQNNFNSLLTEKTIKEYDIMKLDAKLPSELRVDESLSREIGKIFENKTVKVGDLVTFNLKNVQKYSTYAKNVNSEHGIVKKVLPNGVKVVADGIGFHVKNSDLLKEAVKKDSLKGKYNSVAKTITYQNVDSDNIDEDVYHDLGILKLSNVKAKACWESEEPYIKVYGELNENDTSDINVPGTVAFKVKPSFWEGGASLSKILENKDFENFVLENCLGTEKYIIGEKFNLKEFLASKTYGIQHEIIKEYYGKK